MPLLGQSVFHRTVINRFLDTHIKGYGIGRISPAFQISLVLSKQICIKLVKQDLLVIHKTAETPESGSVGFRRWSGVYQSSLWFQQYPAAFFRRT